MPSMRPSAFGAQNVVPKERVDAKRISQETFDGVVQENMEEFDMSQEEAIADAIEQFQTQGVDLSNIVKSGASDSKPAVLEAIAALQTLELAVESEELLELLAKIAEECKESKETRSIAVHRGVVSLLLSHTEAWLSHPSSPALPATLIALGNVLRDTEARDAVGKGGMATLAQVMKEANEEEEVLLRSLFCLKFAMVGQEPNRQSFCNKEKGGINGLPDVVAVLHDHKDHAKILTQACGVLRVVTMQDDPRAPFCKGFEHARLAAEFGAVAAVLQMLKTWTDTTMLCEVLNTLSKLTANNTICEDIANNGGIELALDLSQQHPSHLELSRNCCRFLAAIAGNDDCKVQIVQKGGHLVVLRGMQAHMADVGVAERACALISILCMRQPANCTAIAECGGVAVVVVGMRTHWSHVGYQNQACLALRNMVSRNKELREKVLAEGVEPLLRHLMTVGPPLTDKAKAALRDLGCDIQLVEQWKGMPGEDKRLAQGNGELRGDIDAFNKANQEYQESCEQDGFE